MRSDEGPVLRRSQRSVSYSADMVGQDDPVTPPDYMSELYPSMLIEDVALAIMPVGGHSENSRFRVSVEPPDRRAEGLVNDAIARHGRAGTLAESACDFLYSCSRTMLSYGRATYELVYLSREDEAKAAAFELVSIPALTVCRRGRKMVQHIPAEEARRRGVPRRIELEGDRVLTFELPRRIRNEFGRIMGTLSRLSKQFIPEFALEQTEDPSKRVPYDSGVHIREMHLAIARAGKVIGWNARETFVDEVLEYYWMERQLRFEQFKADLRKSILEVLNDGLKRAGRELGFEVEIKIDGMPTTDDVRAAREELGKGTRTFREILNPFMRL